MKLYKPFVVLAITLSSLLALFLIYSHLDYFGNVSFLGGILLLEIIVGCLWKYDQRFFPLLMIAFLFAGMAVPLQGAANSGRWVVLAAGAIVGCVMWIKSPRKHFGAFHLIALFCVCTAFVSATVSPFLHMAMSKALSLLLLFVYGSAGARLAVVGREGRFLGEVLWGCEVAVYATAVCYFGLGLSLWGNPNSLGTAMSIGAFPILLWGWFTSDAGVVRWRRSAALLLCTYLALFSHERAGMAAIAVVCLAFCFGLHQYKLLLRVAALSLGLIAVTGLVAPTRLSQSSENLKNAVLYKGHKEAGVLGSRRTPWEQTVASIKEHPLFGAGYGTSPSGEDTDFDINRFSSTGKASREHGSGYLTIVEWVGLLGVLPFLMLLGLTALNMGRVFVWMRKTANPDHCSVPMAMVLLAGFVHTTFEDWLFAVGSYPCVFFWAFAFMLTDCVPTGTVLVSRALSSFSRPPEVGLEAIAPSR